ncbi:OX-2 membrane glycoprotein-like isoform X2 [Nelusetta ayraudi]|uniref:OX-2 membrane glycoprotein-like isoform X2 n=1 Tax=Nelusetta ayraudi TaxID=303726 RepID=UPI003F6E9939
MSNQVSKAAELQITGHGDVTAIYGTDAHYTCAVDDSTGVQQVTWQKLSEDAPIQNLATYSKQFGQQVNSPFQDKVFFTKASLGSSSITLKNVTWDDDSCYICSFNAFPSGSKQQQSCLEVQGISEVKTSSLEREGTQEVVFSCSTTGRPPPTINWAFSDDHFLVRQGEATMTTNDDGTFTISQNVSLRAPPGQSGHVDCLANRGMAGERRERVTFLFSFEQKTPEEEHKPWSLVGPLMACTLILVTVAAAVAIITAKRWFKQHRTLEML